MKKVKINLRGFPGWHTECVVMATKYLEIPFDIHTGGIDHISIHHPNEIAQAEAAYGKIPARFWLHGEFLVLKKERMGKSAGKIVTLENLIEKGFNPLGYRYLCLGTHYRKKLQFSWPILKAAQFALNNLYQKISEISETKKSKLYENRSRNIVRDYGEKFLEFINDDLNTPKALALMWNVLKNKNLSSQEKYSLLLDFDKIFALDFAKIKKPKIPQKIKKLVETRERYRKEGKWKKADEIRRKIKKMGWQIEDTKKGPKIKKLSQ